jgi:hypothetical protein
VREGEVFRGTDWRARCKMFPRAIISYEFFFYFFPEKTKKKVREEVTAIWLRLMGGGRVYSTHVGFEFGAHIHEAPPPRLWDMFETFENQNIKRRDVKA